VLPNGPGDQVASHRNDVEMNAIEWILKSVLFLTQQACEAGVLLPFFCRSSLHILIIPY
jgi:hypothetical protein